MRYFPQWGEKFSKEKKIIEQMYKSPSNTFHLTSATLMLVGGIIQQPFVLATGMAMLTYTTYALGKNLLQFRQVERRAEILNSWLNNIPTQFLSKPTLYKDHVFVPGKSYYDATSHLLIYYNNMDYVGRIAYLIQDQKLYIAAVQGAKGKKSRWTRFLREYLKQLGIEVYMVEPSQNAFLKPHPGLQNPPKLPFSIYQNVFLGKEEVVPLAGVFDSKGYYILGNFHFDNLPRNKDGEWLRGLFEEKELVVKSLA